MKLERTLKYIPDISRKELQDVAPEPGPTPQLGHFRSLIHSGGALFKFLNSHSAGKVELEPGPAPHVAVSFF